MCEGDGSGACEPGEPGIPGVTVKLYDGTGAEIASTTTDANGDYSFTNLIPDTYSVMETNLLGYTSVGDADGGANGFDRIDGIVVNGDDVADQDFEDQADPGTINGTVYDDLNGNGVHDDGELGIPGVEVCASDSSGAETCATTDGNGNYSIPNLPPDTYTVIETDPAGYDSTGDTWGANDNIIVVDLGPGETSEDNDYLDVLPAQISGTVCGGSVVVNGTCEVGEAGIGGVTVSLKDAGGTVIATTTTDANGDYAFTNLPPGYYEIIETNPPGYDSQSDADGGDPDSITKLSADSFFLAGGQDAVDRDFEDGITSYTLSKALVPPNGAVRPGERIKFTISIENTGDTWISFLPLQDNYDPAYISYGNDGMYADPDDSVNEDDDGQIDWTDLTASRTVDLAPGVTWSIDVYFTGVQDTTSLEPNGTTTNQVIVQNALADPDGPDGPLPPDIVVPDGEATAEVQVIQATAVTMAGFDASVLDEDVLLYWTTNSELEIAGFNVLRSLDGPFERLNSTMIPAMAAGTNTGNVYSYLDNNVALSETYEYQLEIMLLDGNSQLFGLQEITVAADFQTYLGLIAK